MSTHAALEIGRELIFRDGDCVVSLKVDPETCCLRMTSKRIGETVVDKGLVPTPVNIYS